MQKEQKLFGLSIAIPLITGALSALISGGMAQFSTLIKPPLSPPGILFPIVWTILYSLMGIAAFLVFSSGEKPQKIKNALTVYALQLAVNFFWSVFFFRQEWYLFSFFWLILLWILIFYTTVLFYEISKPAGRLLVPYLVWVTFAGYLNLGVFLLN